MNRKQKKEFVLDCCNSQRSKLQPYQSIKDTNLEGYFAFKRKKNKAKSGNNLKKSEVSSKKNLVKLPYIKNSARLSHSVTSRSLPPNESRKKLVQPISKDEFLALISKYRNIN